jgi:hypothetical protein
MVLSNQSPGEAGTDYRTSVGPCSWREVLLVFEDSELTAGVPRVPIVRAREKTALCAVAVPRVTAPSVRRTSVGPCSGRASERFCLFLKIQNRYFLIIRGFDCF